MLSGRNAASAWTLQTNAVSALGYLPGDVVIVDTSRRAGAGDIVCARTTHPAGTIFRVYEPPYLLAAVTDPMRASALRRPLIVDNDRVSIVGVVTDTWRRATKPAPTK